MRLNQFSPTRFIHAMNQRTTSAQKASQQLSTGIDMKSPSDYLRASRAESDMRERQVIQRNLSDERQMLHRKADVLTVGQTMGMRLKELATQLDNDTLNEDDKLIIFKEANAIKNEMVTLFEEAEFNRKPLFNLQEKETVFDVDNFSTTSIHEVMQPTSTTHTGDSDRINATVTKPYHLAIEAYASQKNITTSQTVNQTNQTTASTDLSFSERFVADLSVESLKGVADTYDYQAVSDYLSTTSAQDVYTTLASYSFDELETLAVEQGYDEGFEALIQQGIFSLIGLEGAPELVEGDNYYNSYTLIQQEHQQVIDNSADHSARIDDDSITNIDTTIHDNSDNNSHNTMIKDGINIALGDTAGDVTIHINTPSDNEDITHADMPEDFAQLLTPEAIDTYVLDPIAKSLGDTGIKQNLIDFRSSLESQLTIRSEQQLSSIRDTDIAQTLADKQKETMLAEINTFLFQDTLQKQGNILNLLA